MEFESFFDALYRDDCEGTSRAPFPWQKRLANEVVEQGWPGVLDLPTASGKTSAMDIALFHLIEQVAAIQAGKLDRRTAPLRIFFIVDRRIVVDGAYQHARNVARRLREARDGVLAQAAEVLTSYFQVQQPLRVSVMRGGMYRDNGWSASPVQPTVCVSTVDQVGSRLLFRGYGVTPSMRPIHAGLVANDSLLLVDEAHLSEPFLQTLESVKLYSQGSFSERPVARPMTVVRMSATTQPGEEDHPAFQINDDDRQHPVLGTRLLARKIATLERVSVNRDDPSAAEDELAARFVTRAIELSELASANEVPEKKAVKRKKPKKPASGETTTAVDEVAPARVIGIVVNRVRTARKIFDRLRRRKGQFRDPLDPASGDAFSSDHLAETILLTGRMRPFDRDELLYRTRVAGERGWLRWIEAGRSGPPPRPVFVVATQTVEVGADLDFDALVTEVAPLDCLRQRFGRLDRRGARRTSRALILGKSTDLGKTAEDRVYGTRLSATWQWLDKNASGKGKGKTIDFGISAMEERLADADLGSLCATVPDAPTLLPPYVALWARTNPAPAADPDVDPFLHGPNTAPADVQVVWRADLLQPGETELKRTRIYLNTLAMLPPTSMEACSVPIYEVQRWLDTVGASEGQNAAAIGDLADVEGGQLVETRPSKSAKTDKLVVRWKGAEDSLFGHAKDIRPGDTIVVPASYGGHDKFGWQPASPEVQDVADNCSRWGRARAMIRLHPSLFTERQWGSIPLDVLPSDEDHIEDALLALSEFEKLPEALRRSSAELVDQKTRWIMPYATPFGSDRPWVVVGKKRLTIDELLQETHGEVNDQVEETLPEDDVVSSLSGSGEPTTLAAHTDGVVWHVALFASLAGIDPAIASDLRLVAEWHDIGKVDERFQTLLHNGDYVSAVMALASGQPLAKSGRTYRDRAAGQRAAASAGVPKKFRHEALTVVLLRETELQQVLNGANDSELVEYLSGSHHGNGRASHPVVVDSPPAIETAWRSHKVVVDTETQLASAPYRLDNDWEGLFVRMNRRYGWWGLAWLEAIFRLADHCQSALDAAKPQVASKESIV